MIRFSLRKSQPVTLTVYNLRGIEVYHRALGVLIPGDHRIQLSGSEIFPGKASGIYILKLGGKYAIQSQKLVLLK